jgi:hypothetical protein
MWSRSLLLLLLGNRIIERRLIEADRHDLSHIGRLKAIDVYEDGPRVA